MVLIYLYVSVEGRLVIPWTVASMNESISFAQLFEKLQAGTTETFEQYAGNPQQHSVVSPRSEKEHSILLTGILLLDDVCSQFGSFVKLLCDVANLQMEATTSISTTAMRNAFDVLMRSQAALFQRHRFPQKIYSHNKKMSFSMI